MPETPVPGAPVAAAPRAHAVKPKNAASLIVVRQGSHGTEALMGMRGAKHRFMPNRMVFPGGKVDRADYSARIAAPLRPDVLLRLEKASAPRLCHALAHAAARELEEESGLSLGRPPSLDGLDFLCRAITPPVNPMRFDARFLIVDAACVSGTVGGSGELEELRYYPIAEALALDLAFVTRLVLEQAQSYLALTPEERRERVRTPLLRNRKWELQ